MTCKDMMSPMNVEVLANTVSLGPQSLLALLSWNRRREGIVASVSWEE